MVEDNKVLDELGEHRHLLLSVIVHDLHGQLGAVGIGAVQAQLFGDEPLLGGGQFALGDGRIVGSEGAIELDVVAIDRMVGIICDRVIVSGCTADGALGEIGDVVGVAEGAVIDRVLQALDGLTSQQVVHGAVFHDQNDNILDLGLEILDGGVGVSLMAGVCRDGRGSGSKGQQTDQRTGMHGELVGG